MKFVLVFGPQASGKMTVSQKLSRLTNLKLLYNHMTIDLLEPFFGFGPEMWRLSTLFREEIFKSVAKSDLEGMIFTFVWAFNQEQDWDFVDKTCEIFERQGAEVFLVELEADLNERLERNKSPHRLAHKPTKRDVAASEYELRESMKMHRLNSHDGEIKRENYLKINNTKLSASEVAELIVEQFGL